jgi:alkanesulfonate monooxygenase SsuD/methylene tetrahydromethanopterin reductase-like flavin-dependent oxidoreductase (luciferase family)
MKFTYYINAQTPGAEHDADIIETCIEQAVRATHSGFVGVGLTEHHFSEWNTYSSNLMLAAHLCGRCAPETRFIQTAVIAPLHNPIALAEHINLVDVLTKGNTIVGVATGGDAMEFVGLGRNPENKQEDFDAVMTTMKAAWNMNDGDPPLKWSTRYETGTIYSRLMPSAYRRKHPPLARMTISDKAAHDAGLAGEYIYMARLELAELLQRLDVYRDAMVKAGFSQDVIDDRLEWSFCFRNVIVRRSDAEAYDEAIRRVQMLHAYGLRTSAKIPGGALKAVIGPTGNPEEYVRKQFIVGSPKSVIDQIAAYRNAGVRHLGMLFNFSFMSREEANASLESFIGDVLPAFSISTQGATRAGASAQR